MTSFATTNTVDVAMRSNFKTPIKNAVNSMVFNGATFSQGGLADGLAQNNSVATTPGFYQGTLNLFTNGGNVSVPVTLQFGSTGGGGSGLAATPNPVTFSVQTGGGVPAP